MRANFAVRLGSGLACNVFAPLLLSNLCCHSRLEVDLDLFTKLGVDFLKGKTDCLFDVSDIDCKRMDMGLTSGKVNQMAMVLMTVTTTKIM